MRPLRISIASGTVGSLTGLVLGYGVALSTGLFAFDFTGGSLFGYSKDKTEDEFDRRTKLRKAFQTPAEQTFAELGEGRGMFSPMPF